MVRFLILTALCACSPLWAAQASECIKPQSVMLLQNSDENRLGLARALKAYLKAEGQDERLATSIYKASLKTGVDFKLMVLKAKMESDLGRFTAAKHTTARGVFQYIEPTWLTLINRYGDDLGHEHYADVIERPKYPGVPTVTNPYLKSEILGLRHDVDTSAMIKAYQIREETDVIKSFKRGRKVTVTDHYIAHMLGLPLAKQFYRMKYAGSKAPVARVRNAAMREAAVMNKPFFFSGKRALNAHEAYNKFEARVERDLKAIQTAAYSQKVAACADPPTHLAAIKFN